MGISAPRTLVDIRDREPTGIHNYALGALANPGDLGLEVGELRILCEPHQVAPVLALGFNRSRIVVAAEREHLCRFSTPVLEQIRSLDPDLYVSMSNFYDPRVCATTWIVVHDLIRLDRSISRDYSIDQFAHRYGASEASRLSAALRFLDPTADPVTGANLVSQYVDLLSCRAMKEVDRVIAPSDRTANELRATFWQWSRHVDVVPPRVRGGLIRSEESPVKTLQGADFLLFVGTPSAHKRLDLVVETLRRSKYREVRDLVVAVAGSRSGDGLFARSPRLPESRAAVDLGYVSDAELRWLYAHAVATVVPSRAEGYCLPVDEAVACGGRVIAADFPALGTRAIDPRIQVFDLGDEAGLEAAVRTALRSVT